MQQWLGKSLKHKLSLLIIIATLVPLLFLGIFSFNIAKSLTEEKAKITGMNTLRQLEAYLDTMVRTWRISRCFSSGIPVCKPI